MKCRCVGDASVVFDSINTRLPKFLDCNLIEILDEDDLQHNLVLPLG